MLVKAYYLSRKIQWRNIIKMQFMWVEDQGSYFFSNGKATPWEAEGYFRTKFYRTREEAIADKANPLRQELAKLYPRQPTVITTKQLETASELHADFTLADRVLEWLKTLPPSHENDFFIKKQTKTLKKADSALEDYLNYLLDLKVEHVRTNLLIAERKQSVLRQLAKYRALSWAHIEQEQLC